MSWWPVPDTADDVTGDGPADAVDGALLGLAESRRQRDQTKPSLPELLRALEIAFTAKSDLVQDAPASPRVSTKDGMQASADAPDDLIEAVQQALTEIAESFRRDLSRLPRVVEILYTFAFSLGGEPESVLSAPIPERIVFVLK